jgi:adenylate kinase
MKRVIVITGTPGTGKTTISEKLAESLKDSELIKANDVVKERKLFTSYSKDGSMIVRMDALRKELERRIKKSDADFVIVEGHLLCDIRIEGATAIVIREHLATLLKRFRKRRYKRQKIEDNIVSEAIDYCGINAQNHYRDVYEFESKPGALAKIVKAAKGEKVDTEEIEMLGELNSLLQKLRS